MYGVRSSFWLVELVGEAFFSHLEFSPIVSDVVYFGRNVIGGHLRI